MPIIIDSAPAPAAAPAEVESPNTFRPFAVVLFIVLGLYLLARNPDLLETAQSVTRVNAVSNTQVFITEPQIQHMVLAALAQDNFPMLTAPVVDVNTGGIMISAREGMLVFTPAAINGHFGLRLAAINMLHRYSTDPQVAMLNENLGNSIAYLLGGGSLSAQVVQITSREEGLQIELAG